MSNMMFGRGPVLPPAQPDTIREPLAWVSRKVTGSGRRLPGFQFPLGSLLYGLGTIVLGVLMLVFAASVNGGAGVALGVFIFLLLAGLGIWMVVIAAIRWPWYREYQRRHGHKPF